jgi:hypothetical protein
MTRLTPNESAAGDPLIRATPLYQNVLEEGVAV